MKTIGKPQPEEYANYFRRYIDRIGNQDIITFLENQFESYRALLESIPEEKMLYAYAEAKWTIAQVLGHVNDVERVMGYRTFRFSRNDKTVIPGFDDQFYVNNGHFKSRSKESFIQEFTGLRMANLAMIKALTAEQSLSTGKAFEVIFSVRALTYIMAGHMDHHVEVLKTRYGI